MRKTLLLFTTGALLALATGCTKKLNYKDYFSFFNKFEKQSFIEFTDSSCLYKLQYRPANYMALCDIRSKKEAVSSENLKSKQTELSSGGYNFCIRISSMSDTPILDENDVEYYSKISQLSNDFPFLLYGLTESGDTAYCRFSHFERSYNLQPFAQILFNLNSENSSEIKKVCFSDEIFNDGSLIEFETTRYIKNLPKLKI